MAVRLAWHASGTYSAADQTGGDGATMRFEPESEDGANAGSASSTTCCSSRSSASSAGALVADIWTLAGCVAIEESGGPKIEHHLGRTDASVESARVPGGRLPDAAQGAQHLRDVFHRMGFDDRDIVALSGAHTLGRCHKTRSGFDGPWTTNPLKWDNSYFKNLTNLEWVPREWDGPLQYADPKNELMMLPTDVALKTDKKFLPHVKEFAKDEAAFNKAFAAAMERLIALGCHASVQPGAAAAAAVADETDRLSRELREHCMHCSPSTRRHAGRARRRRRRASRPTRGARRSTRRRSGAAHHIVPWRTRCLPTSTPEDYNGDTALHDAARFGHDKCIDALLGAAGVDVSVVNKEGKTAHDVAVENGKKPRAGLSAGGGCVVS